MPIGWIDSIYNNTDQEIRIKSEDDGHNGVVRGGGTQFALDDRQYHTFAPRTGYIADWFGIPWYWRGIHYKAVTVNENNEVRFFQSFIDGRNWVIYQNGNTGAQVGRQEVARSVDYRCTLRFEIDPADQGGAPLIFLDVVNDDGSTEQAIVAVRNEVQAWIETTKGILAEVVKAILT